MRSVTIRSAMRTVVVSSLGLLTCLLVALSSVILDRIRHVDERSAFQTSSDGSTSVIRSYWRPAVTHIVAYPASNQFQPHHTEINIGGELPSWASHLPAIPLSPSLRRVEVTARGFPMRAFISERRVLINDANEMLSSVSNGILLKRILPPADSTIDYNYTIIPYGIIWTGCVINTAVYAVVWAMVLRLRRYLRTSMWVISARALCLLMIIAILFGIGMTAAAAAWSALWLDETFDGNDDQLGASTGSNGHYYWRIQKRVEPGAIRLISWWRPRVPSDESVALVQAESVAGKWASHLEPTTPSGARAVDARGWPFIAFWGSFEGEPMYVGRDLNYRVTETYGALLVGTHDKILGAPTFRCLPLIPIWSGLVLNICVFSLAFGIISIGFIGPSVITRTLRLKQGRCPSCGYKVFYNSALVGCSECGWGR